MLYYQGLKCPVCGKPFFDGEDIVTCPKCGLPHHRACWMQEGHCHLETLHDTDEQWSRDNATTPTVAEEDNKPARGKACPRCGAENLEFAEFCNRCGSPMATKEWCQPGQQPPAYQEYSPFQSPFRSSYSKDEQIGDYSAKDLADSVGSNTAYYIPRFRRIATSGSGGWNWAAFLFGPYWLIYRKNYLLGILYFVVQTAYTLLSNLILAGFQSATTMEDIQAITDALMATKTGQWSLLILMIVSLVLFIARILLGAQANRLYFRDCKRRIDRALTAEGGLRTEELLAKGGVSMTAATIAYFIPNLIYYILLIFKVQ